MEFIPPAEVHALEGVRLVHDHPVGADHPEEVGREFHRGETHLAVDQVDAALDHVVHPHPCGLFREDLGHHANLGDVVADHEIARK